MANPPFPDPSAGCNPLIGSIYESGEILIAENRRRYALAPACYLRILHRISPSWKEEAANFELLGLIFPVDLVIVSATNCAAL